MTQRRRHESPLTIHYALPSSDSEPTDAADDDDDDDDDHERLRRRALVTRWGANDTHSSESTEGGPSAFNDSDDSSGCAFTRGDYDYVDSSSQITANLWCAWVNPWGGSAYVVLDCLIDYPGRSQTRGSNSGVASALGANRRSNNPYSSTERMRTWSNARPDYYARCIDPEMRSRIPRVFENPKSHWEEACNESLARGIVFDSEGRMRCRTPEL